MDVEDGCDEKLRGCGLVVLVVEASKIPCNDVEEEKR